MNGVDLKIARVRSGVRQYRLAAALGVPSTVVWQLESGRRPLSPELADTISQTIKQLAEQEPQKAGGVRSA